MPFSKLNLHPDLARAVKAMAFERPTPIQEAAIPPALEGRDVMGCAQTGGGKTASFALPILHRLLTSEERPGIRALVLTPTRELAAQVNQTFRDLARFTALRSAVVIGGVGFHPQIRPARECQILIATPGRLLDHLKQGSFRLNTVEFLVIDEADRMLDMGFLPDMKRVIAQVPRERQTHLFSATLAPEVQKIAAFALLNPIRVEVERPSTVAEGISQILYPVVQSHKAGLLLELLRSTEMKSALIFTRTKHGADRLAKRLTASGHTVGVLHGDRSQGQRTAAMEGFRHGRLRLMVATDIAARGIDVKGISHVINFDVPRAPEDYVHRVGRTARAYGVGDAVTFMDPGTETGLIRDIERHTGIVFPRAVLPNFHYNTPPDLPAPARPQGQGPSRERRRDRSPSFVPGKPKQGPHGSGNKNRRGGPSHGSHRSGSGGGFSHPPKGGGESHRSRDGGRPPRGWS